MKVQEQIVNDKRVYVTQVGSIMDADLIDSAVQDWQDIETSLNDVMKLIDEVNKKYQTKI